MGTVIDASAAVAWLLRADESRALAVESVLPGALLVPVVWQDEVANALVMAERRGRVTQEARSRLAGQVAALDVELCPSPGIPSISRLAAETGLTAYDAEYLHLAIDRGATLLTLDLELADAARRRGVRIA